MPEFPGLTESQRHQIEQTLKVWANVHPCPDLPVIQLADGSELTPRDMAAAVADPESRRGRLLYRVFAKGLIDDGIEPPETLDGILADYWRDVENWDHDRIRVP
jgi:hypothetical protein